MLGVIELNPQGNAVAMCRLSGDDHDDSLIDQVQKALAIEANHSETLSIRYVLLALDMSGTREVRPQRALAPPPGTLERDDILLLEKWFAEGWVEHAIWRDGRRIAREILPAETILASLRRNRVNLWLVVYGRMIDWNSDRLGIRALNLVSAENRDNIDRELHDARLRKGPLSGNGWQNTPPRFGFYREPRTLQLIEDDEQWPWIHRVFELADVGDFANDGGLSTRALAKRLKEEGCPFDHDRLRQILKDPIYATGEYHVLVAGIPVAQRPIPLKNPVPLDRYLRVQTKLELRQGSTKRTPLGEFLFNYADVVHKQCADERSAKGAPILIKGYIDPNYEDRRMLCHVPTVPAKCHGRGRGQRGGARWERDDLEPPVVELLRGLVEHPAVLEQAAIAARHQITETSPRLTDEQRAQLELELVALEQRLDAAAEEWVESAAKDPTLEIAEYQRLAGALRRKQDSIRYRLEADASANGAGSARPTPQNEEEFKKAFLEILTVETPSDPFMLQLRARLFQCLVSRIEIDDDGDPAKPVVLTVEGHLAPAGDGAAASPLAASRDLLSSYIEQRDGKTSEPARQLAELERLKTEVAEAAPDTQTAYEYGYHKSVSALTAHFFSVSHPALRAAVRGDLRATHWAFGSRAYRRNRGKPVAPAWTSMQVVPAWATMQDVPAWRVTLSVFPRAGSERALAARLRHPTAVRIVETIAALGEATVPEISAVTGFPLHRIYQCLELLRPARRVVIVRGRGTASSPAVYAVPPTRRASESGSAATRPSRP